MVLARGSLWDDLDDRRKCRGGSFTDGDPHIQIHALHNGWLVAGNHVKDPDAHPPVAPAFAVRKDVALEPERGLRPIPSRPLVRRNVPLAGCEHERIAPHNFRAVVAASFVADSTASPGGTTSPRNLCASASALASSCGVGVPHLPNRWVWVPAVAFPDRGIGQGGHRPDPKDRDNQSDQSFAP